MHTRYVFIWILLKMSREFYFLCILILGFSCKTARPEATFGSYGVRINVHPSSSCLAFQHVINSLYCFRTCLRKLPSLNMFSHNEDDLRCMCCNDAPANESLMNGAAWETYVPAYCPSGYVQFQYYYLHICLKYVPTNSSYPDAVNDCKKDGGDLIRIDTTAKYDIFKNFAGTYAANGSIQIWVQGVKENGQWKFHDGSSMPAVCPVVESNVSGENYMRSISVYDFECADVKATVLYNYISEKINF